MKSDDMTQLTSSEYVQQFHVHEILEDTEHTKELFQHNNPLFNEFTPVGENFSVSVMCDQDGVTPIVSLPIDGKTISFDYIKKSSTFLGGSLRFIYIPPLKSLGITTGETSITIDWTPLEENTLYIIKHSNPVKIRITNPRAALFATTIK